ncbi:hypothetical protein B0A54_04991 [Friedmanniomyces endolithicus]|uniref:Uncharacterized protein n=1 Tax=Friedmanniomyces endolithicus TaxID=329885 RepID=A0A4U0V678_9PEZI|nr:hypothetical protein B0A54_04991 [Friedmanniomyces endolithicus]
MPYLKYYLGFIAYIAYVKGSKTCIILPLILQNKNKEVISEVKFYNNLQLFNVAAKLNALEAYLRICHATAAEDLLERTA